MKLLEGKVALITGAGRGIGKAMAQVFVSHGARVVVGDIQWVTESADEVNTRSPDSASQSFWMYPIRKV